MTTKIIVADDSQTIQKVIKITFGNRKYDLIPCLNEAELMNNLSDDISLVLLDFSLSETKSGYELGREVRSKTSGVPIMALLGTFDTVDEDNFRTAGYSDKVVKPFETEKFISKCEDLVANGASALEANTEFEEDEDDEISGWDINSPQAEEVYEEAEVVEEYDETPVENNNELSQELGGWGFSGPNLKGSDVTSDYEEFPPVIEASSEQPVESTETGFASKFLSAENLISEADIDSGLDNAFDATFDGDHVEQTPEEVIHDSVSIDELDSGAEVEAEIDAFWSVDDVDEDIIDQEEVVQAQEEVQVESPIVEEVSFSAEEVDEVVSAETATVSMVMPEELEQKLRSDLGPIVEKYVQEYCKERVEKVVWEIIPDLAENLIKKELKEISKKVLRSMDN